MGLDSGSHLSRITWANRKRVGDLSEKRFIKKMEADGYIIFPVDNAVHNHESRLARHFPDLFLFDVGVFIQVKSGLRSGEWPSVIAEVDSINACQMMRSNNRVWVVWEMPDGTFRGNDVENLDPIGEISEQARGNGSGTPAYKFLKTQLFDIDDLLLGE